MFSVAGKTVNGEPELNRPNIKFYGRVNHRAWLAFSRQKASCIRGLACSLHISERKQLLDPAPLEDEASLPCGALRVTLSGGYAQTAHEVEKCPATEHRLNARCSRGMEFGVGGIQ